MSGVLPDRLEPLLTELDELWRPSRTKWTLTEVPGATGLKLSHPAQTATTLVQLSAANYFRDEQSVEQIEGPIFFRLGERALQRVAGWPGAGGDLASELLALIDQRLEDPTVSEDERTRLERLRDTVGDVGKGVVSGLLTALIKSHTGV
jgi:hypothetical protein